MSKRTSIVAGIDVGDEWSHVHVMDFAQGEVLFEGRVATDPGALRALFGRWKRVRAALEVGTHSPWMQELLEGLGHEVLVANARKLRCIFASTNKQDRLDARVLAKVARMDPSLLYPIRHRARQTREDLAVLWARCHLVRMRAEAVQVVGTGVAVATASVASFAEARVLGRGPMAWFFGLLAGAEIYCDAVAPRKDRRGR